MAKHNPVKYATCIHDDGEKALQRAIIQGGFSMLGNQKVNWLDIEIPVVANGKPREKCLDLVGQCDNGEYVLVELKFKSKKSDGESPKKACEQLIDYRDEIIDHPNDIEGHKKNGIPVSWGEINTNTILIVAANKGYWENWKNEDEIFNTDGVLYYSIDVEEDEYEKQKKESDERGEDGYSPKLNRDSQKYWEQIK